MFFFIGSSNSVRHWNETTEFSHIRFIWRCALICFFVHDFIFLGKTKKKTTKSNCRLVFNTICFFLILLRNRTIQHSFNECYYLSKFWTFSTWFPSDFNHIDEAIDHFQANHLLPFFDAILIIILISNNFSPIYTVMILLWWPRIHWKGLKRKTAINSVWSQSKWPGTESIVLKSCI